MTLCLVRMVSRRLAALLFAPLVLAACGPGSKAPASPTASPTVVVAAAATKPAAPTAVPATPTPTGTTYTVKDGDTLSGIASSNNSTVAAIVQANNLTDPDKLQVGQKLTIPPAGSAAASAAAGNAAAKPAASGSAAGSVAPSGSPVPSRPPPP